MCIPALAEVDIGKGRRGVSFWTELSSSRYILGGTVALLGLLGLRNFRIDHSMRILVLCGIFMLFGVFFVFISPCPIGALTNPLGFLSRGSIVFPSIWRLF